MSDLILIDQGDWISATGSGVGSVLVDPYTVLWGGGGTLWDQLNIKMLLKLLSIFSLCFWSGILIILACASLCKETTKKLIP